MGELTVSKEVEKVGKSIIKALAALDKAIAEAEAQSKALKELSLQLIQEAPPPPLKVTGKSKREILEEIDNHKKEVKVKVEVPTKKQKVSLVQDKKKSKKA